MEAFAAGGSLPTDAIHWLVKALYNGSTIWNETSDLLESANREPVKPLAPCRPAPFVRGPDSYDPVAIARGSRLKFETPQAEKPKRAGRLSSWL